MLGGNFCQVPLAALVEATDLGKKWKVFHGRQSMFCGSLGHWDLHMQHPSGCTPHNNSVISDTVNLSFRGTSRGQRLNSKCLSVKAAE